MNLLLLEPDQLVADGAVVRDARRLAHIRDTLALQVGDTLKVGLRDGLKGTGQIAAWSDQELRLEELTLDHAPPDKRPVIAVVALPRPKVLRRLVMDAVTLGVQALILIHSYRVEKSYWQSPLLKQQDEWVRLGLEQAGDTVWPPIQHHRRFRPFIADRLPELLRGRQGLLAHPHAAQSFPARVQQPSVLLVGPEGGWIPFEAELIERQGVTSYHLGARILRTETALAVLASRFG